MWTHTKATQRYRTKPKSEEETTGIVDQTKERERRKNEEARVDCKRKFARVCKESKKTAVHRHLVLFSSLHTLGPDELQPAAYHGRSLDARSSGRQSRCRPGKLVKTSFTGKCYKQRVTDRLHTGSRKELCPSAALSTHIPSARQEEPGAPTYFRSSVKAYTTPSSVTRSLSCVSLGR